MKRDDLQETLLAIRELAHSSCHLANLAARLTRGSDDPDAARASQAALEASTLAAESAFTLDDALRGELDPSTIQWISMETLDHAQHAVRQARESVEAALYLLLRAPPVRGR